MGNAVRADAGTANNGGVGRADPGRKAVLEQMAVVGWGVGPGRETVVGWGTTVGGAERSDEDGGGNSAVID